MRQKKRGLLKRIRIWTSILPGTKRDYFLLSLAVLDIVFLLFMNFYGQFVGGSAYILLFDLFVIVIWIIDILIKYRKEKEKKNYFGNHWYEVLGIIPLYFFRPFLLLRGVKFVIAFYKFGRSNTNFTQLISREVSFKFRDIIVDSIADAVFLHSLQRVEEVMMRLDYQALVENSYSKYSDHFENNVNESLKKKFFLGELAKIPFMKEISIRLGQDVTDTIHDLIKNEVTGSIIKDVTKSILNEMSSRLKELEIDRITKK